MFQLYLVIGTAIIITTCKALNYSRPRFLNKPFKRSKPIPPYFFATMYPPSAVVERDLPRFFWTYSIATPQNKAARKAVRKIVASRRALKEPNVKVLLKAWDTFNVRQLVQHNNVVPIFHKSILIALKNEKMIWSCGACSLPKLWRASFWSRYN